jgi:transcriptional regulator with XRE-family HTH domain
VTPEAFRATQDRLGLSGKELGEALGKSQDTIVRYRQQGVPERESRAIRLALAALSYGLPPVPDS